MTRMHKAAFSTAAAILLLGIGAGAQAQSNAKIGYVNLQAILQNAPQIPGMNQTLRDEFAERDLDFQRLQEEFNESVETLDRDRDVMAEAERTAMERDLTQRRRDLERRAQELQEDLEIRRDELLGELQLEIIEKVQAYAELNDFDLVVTDAIYVTEAVDISAAVYDAISSAVLGAPESSSEE